MPTIAEQLTQLESDRQDLVSNLQTKGITGLTGDETFTALVPEVLNIPSGGGSDLDKLIDGTITSVTSSATNIKNYVFYGCTSLISASFSSATTIGNYAFQNCTSLTTISLQNASGTLGSYAFQGCSALTSINLPLVTSIGSRAFENCTSLTAVSLSSATTLGNYAFQGCSSLTSINIPNATRINQQCFQNCTSLVSIDLPKVTSIYSFAFYGCTNLTSVTLREEQVCTLSSADAFQNITNKVTIYVPSSLVETYKSSTGWAMLYNNNLVDFVAIS